MTSLFLFCAGVIVYLVIGLCVALISKGRFGNYEPCSPAGTVLLWFFILGLLIAQSVDDQVSQGYRKIYKSGQKQ